MSVITAFIVPSQSSTPIHYIRENLHLTVGSFFLMRTKTENVLYKIAKIDYVVDATNSESPEFQQLVYLTFHS